MIATPRLLAASLGVAAVLLAASASAGTDGPKGITVPPGTTGWMELNEHLYRFDNNHNVVLCGVHANEAAPPRYNGPVCARRDQEHEDGPFLTPAAFVHEFVGPAAAFVGFGLKYGLENSIFVFYSNTPVTPPPPPAPWPSRPYASYAWEIILTATLGYAHAPVLTAAALVVLFCFSYMGYGALGTVLAILALFINRRRVIMQADAVLAGPASNNRAETERMLSTLRSILSQR